MTTSKRAHFGFLVLSGALSLQYFAACSGDSAAGTSGAGGTAGSGGSGGAAGPNTTGSNGVAGPNTTGSGVGGSDPCGNAGPCGTFGVGGAAGPSTAADSGGVTATTTGGPPSADLFACLELSCAPVCSDVGGLGNCGDASALTCVKSVWASGESGVVMQEHRPDPYDQSDYLYVLLGDGQALTQWRSRECRTADNCDVEAKPWGVANFQQRCQVGASFPYVEDCVLADYSCDDIKDMLAGAGGSAGGGGEAGRAGATAE